MYIGHKRKDGEIQPLKAHLEGVAELSARFADAFGAAAHGRQTGLLHDIGKYAAPVQRRMADPEHVGKVDHSTAGAQEAWGRKDMFAAFAIAGHHGGLMNMGSRGSVAMDGTLRGRMKNVLPGDCSAWKGEIAVEGQSQFPPWLSPEDFFAPQFYIRMLFSCLVDADFLDTEGFMRPDAPPRGGGEPLPALLKRLQDHVSHWFPAKNPFNQKRCDVLTQCAMAGSLPRGLYTLTEPTGAGKTVSSLAMALTHAVANGLARVIYVVPYTSIIEQNAQVFRDILGDANVLEHHANVALEEDKDDAAAPAEMRRRLAAENWDAPVIVTTAVQFFESLYASKTSKCRKLHHMANSVIIFDEAQMMPLPYLRPCVAAIAQLVKNYRATAILCTATQPALNGLFHEFAPGLPIREIVDDPQALFCYFKRTRFVREGEVLNRELAQRLAESPQVLCIVNSRRRAQQVYDLMAGEGVYHLSTLMTPEHRRAKLAQIRQRLAEGLTCRVISTSLVEAGVDLDFPEVWREEAGLDSILQAAGRCNREGKRPLGQSIVHVFAGEGGAPKAFAAQVAAMQNATEKREIDSLEAIRVYFEALLKFKGPSLDQEDILSLCRSMSLAEIAKKFHLIDSETVAVYIPSDENKALLEALRAGHYTRQTLRSLGQSAVNIYEQHVKALQSYGKLEITPDGFAILADTNCYSKEKGLLLEPEAGAASWG